MAHSASDSETPTSSSSVSVMKQEKMDASDDSVSAGSEPSGQSQLPTDHEKSNVGPPAQTEQERNYQPKTLKFWLIVLSTFMAMFLVALDRTIIVTALPRITDDFQSLGDIGWYGSAYMLSSAAFQLLFGRIYRYYSTRWTFLFCIVLFEVGSAVCGAAPNSPVFIVGRAIAGVGSAGIWIGAMMVIIPMVPLHKRPMFQSLFGMVFGISSVVGPLIGGAFTKLVTWRWCFYMNLPVGGVALILLQLFLDKEEKDSGSAKLSFKQQMLQLDPLGTFLFVPSIVCLLLALEWGSSIYPWSNWRIILLFVLFGVVGLAFAFVQVWKPDTATLPVRIIGQRSMLAGTFYMLFLSGSMLMSVYFLPLWFQTTHHIDPVESGVYLIPFVISMVISSFIFAAITQKLGYYVPAMLASACFTAVGSGLMVTFTPHTGSSHWIAYQFLVGFGIGAGLQTFGLAIQTVLSKQDISIGMAISFFAQQLGGAIFVSVGQTLLSTLLSKRLADVPGLENGKNLVNTGATELAELVSPEFRATVVEAYNYGCTRIFAAAVALAGGQLVCGFFMEWKSIKKNKTQGGMRADAPKREADTK